MKIKNLSFTLLVYMFFIPVLAVSGSDEGVPGDKEITQAVEEELLIQPDVAAHLIDVSTNGGIVVLSGAVENLLARERSGEIAIAVRGVRGVVNKIQVNTTKRPDEEIKQDIEQALLTDPATDSYELTASVNNGAVTLSGNVNSWAESMLSENVVKSIRGVTEVKNMLTIKETASRPDDEIAADVKQLLRNDVRVDNGLINVKVKNSKVKLSGTVGSAAEKEQAILHSWVAGVKSVDAEKLEVEPWAHNEDVKENKYTQRSNNQIKTAVEDVLKMDPRIDYSNLSTEVNDGMVVISGTVDHLKAKHAAAEDAENVVGVMYVSNKIKVRPDTILSNNMLESRVKKALERDAYLERFSNLQVAVYNGKAFLKGTVDHNFQKVKAEDIVSRVNGIAAIENNIVVRDELIYKPPALLFNNGELSRSSIEYKEDAEIKEDISSQLWWSPFVDQDAVNIEVKNGVAKLTGTVDSWNEKKTAAQNAFEGGAIAVINELEIKQKK